MTLVPWRTAAAAYEYWHAVDDLVMARRSLLTILRCSIVETVEPSALVALIETLVTLLRHVDKLRVELQAFGESKLGAFTRSEDIPP